MRHVKEQIILQVAEQLLRLVQHLDEGIRPVLVALHVRVEDLEPLVPARVLQHLLQFAPSSLSGRCHHGVLELLTSQIDSSLVPERILSAAAARILDDSGTRS